MRQALILMVILLTLTACTPTTAPAPTISQAESSAAFSATPVPTLIPSSTPIRKETPTASESSAATEAPTSAPTATFVPPVPTVTPAVYPACGGSYSSRLKAGMTALVIPFPPDASRLRDKPDTSGRLLAELKPGSHMKVLSGPECSGGIVWWQVQPEGDGQAGWVAEGKGQEHWLSPCELAGQPLAPLKLDLDAVPASLGKGRLEDSAFSPDGKTLAVATAIGIYLYDPLTQKEVQFIPSTIDLTHIAFTPDGSLWATSTAHINKLDQVQLWQVQGGQLQLKNGLQHGGYNLVPLAFSADGNRLVTSASNYEIKSQPYNLLIWQVSSGELLQELPAQSNIQTASISTAGKRVAGSDYEGNLWFWGDGSQTAAPFHTHSTGGMYADPGVMAFAPGGDELATGGQDLWVALWHVEGSQVKAFGSHLGHQQSITHLAYAPDGKSLASAAQGELNLWIAGNQKAVPVSAPAGRLLVYSPDSRLLVSADQETIYILQAGSGKKIGQISGFNPALTSVAFSPDGQKVAGGSYAAIYLWETASGRLLQRLATRDGTAIDLAFSPDGSLLAAALNGNGDGGFGWARIYDLKDGHEVRTLRDDLLIRVTSLDFSPDGRLLATASEFGAMLWSLADGAPWGLFSYPEKPAKSSWGPIQVSFAPDGRALGFANPVSAAVIDPNQGDESQQKIEGTGQGLRMYDTDTCKWAYRSVSGPELKSLWEIAFSPDGNWLAGSGQGCVSLWEFPIGKPVACMAGHTNAVTGKTFNPDSRLLATSSNDGTIRLWRVGK